MKNFFNYYVSLIREIFLKKRKHKKTYNSKDKNKINLNHLKAFSSKFSDENTKISESTWKDLDMDDIFLEIDNTITTAGESLLYNILKNPEFNRVKLKKRGEYIKYFQKNNKKRNDVQFILSKIGRINYDITSVFCNNLESNIKIKILVYILPIVFILNLLTLIFINKEIFLYTLIGIGITNIFVHYSMGYLIMEQIKVIQYIGRLINKSRKIYLAMKDDLPEYSIELKELYEKCKIIGKKTSILSKIEGIDILADYLNILFLIKERNYFKISKYIENNKNEIINLFFLIGKLDTLISISLYRESIDNFVEPEFLEEDKILEIEGVYHPLLDNPVKNSFNIKKRGVIITGSNMSGKSTFIRTIGVNAIFAQTIYTCLASQYKTSFFNIASSVSLNDNIIKGKSYYLSEAEAIHNIIKICDCSKCSLVLIDEIFNGTNPIERIGAAVEILNYLVEKNTLAIVSTHDLKLTEMIEGYETYYFKEKVSVKGLKFDYSIRKGVCHERNAVKILDYLGYPKELIKKINTRVGLQISRE